jgi:hypothetical protein
VVIDEGSLALEASAPDTDLQDGFFRRGLSVEAMVAQSEQERDRDLFRSGQRRTQRVLVGAAGAGGLLVLVLAGVGFSSGRPEEAAAQPAAPIAAPAPTAAAAPAPAAPAAPVPAAAAVPGAPAQAAVAPAPAAAPAGVPAAGAPATAALPAATAPAGAAPPAPAPTAIPAAIPGSSAPVAAVPAPGAPAPTAAPAAPVAAAAAAPAARPPAPAGATASAAPAGTTTRAAPAPAPAARLAAAAPAPAAAAVPAAQADELRAACTKALGKSKYKDIVESCTAAFDARPVAELAAQVAQNALERGRKADASDWAKKAITADPTFADAFVFLGGAEQELGRRAEAKAAYQRYLELAPNGKYASDITLLLRSL